MHRTSKLISLACRSLADPAEAVSINSALTRVAIPWLGFTQRFNSLSEETDDVAATTASASPSSSQPPHIAAGYKSATELVWPMSRHQQKYASRVGRALSNVLSQDSALREELVESFGFSIKDVRVSPDHAKAFILWDSYMGQPAATERVLRKCTPRLRAAVAKAMAGRNAPRLEFRLDRKTDEHAELDKIFMRLENEREFEKES